MAMKNRGVASLVLLSVWIFSPARIAAQGHSPDQAVSHMKLPDGLRAKLFAS